MVKRKSKSRSRSSSSRRSKASVSEANARKRPLSNVYRNHSPHMVWADENNMKPEVPMLAVTEAMELSHGLDELQRNNYDEKIAELGRVKVT